MISAATQTEPMPAADRLEEDVPPKCLQHEAEAEDDTRMDEQEQPPQMHIEATGQDDQRTHSRQAAGKRRRKETDKTSMRMEEFLQYIKGITKYSWFDDGTRLPLFQGRIVATSSLCYAEHGATEQTTGVFKLSYLKAAIEDLGAGRHCLEQIVDILESRIGARPTSQTLCGCSGAAGAWWMAEGA